MITRNFKMFLAAILQIKSSAATPGYLPVVNVSNVTKYLGFYTSTIANTVLVNSLTNAGIWIGTGSDSPTENDYNLKSRITSGLTASTPTTTQGVDSDGNPYLTYLFTLTNTTSSDITVSEIGYVQNGGASSAIGESTSLDRFLLDRTVLDSPVTVPAGGSAAIEYTLKTVLSE